MNAKATRLERLRGMQDLMGEALARHLHVIQHARQVTGCFGYDEIATPILERTELFARSLGEASDVVGKEMYSFNDKAGAGDPVSVTLRPENTASIARAFISNKMAQSLPVRLFYAGAMFRRERPQKGRLRQFHQIGIEFIGTPSPAADVEVICCGQQVLEALGLAGQVKLHLNSLGNQESRSRWRLALIDYFTRYETSLSDDSKRRLRTNPLRILDSKDARDRALLHDAPRLDSMLDAESKAFFAAVCQGLDDVGIGWQRDHHLVRGLDYYCHSAFEFVSDGLGAQGTVMGGGRYDGLVEQIGGFSTPGVGWAAGIERMAMLCPFVVPERERVAVVAIGDGLQRARLLKLAQELRGQGLVVITPAASVLKKAMREAERAGAGLCLLMGEDEYASGMLQLRDMQSGEQKQIALAEAEQAIRTFFANRA